MEVRNLLSPCFALGKDLHVFVLSLRSAFGDRFLGYLLLNYLLLKGATMTLLQTSMLPYFQHMGVKGVEYQLASTVSMMPWSMKGFIGVLSDIVPLGRFHKRGYLLLSVVLGIFGITMLSFRPESRDESSLWFVAALFGAAYAFLATFDLLCEGKYSEIMREEQAGSEVLSLVWSCMQLGSLIAALCVARVVDTEGPRPLISACLPFAILAFWRTWEGDLPEQPARSWRSLWAKAMSEPDLFLLASAMALGSLMVAVATAMLGERGRVFTALFVSMMMVLYSFRTLPRVLARSNLYMFITSIAYLDLSGPLAYWYTGTENCVKNGPHFSYAYYLAVSNVVGSVGSILGAVLFQYMQDWTFRQAFWVTTTIQVVASLFDLLIISRYNLELGVSDRAAYLFGDAACQSLAQQMALMPQALLTARLCPRGAEATVFAILAGFQNFGANIGSILGAQLSDYAGIKCSRAGPCNFEWLKTLILVCHMLVPLACLPLTWILVPAAVISDEGAFEMSSPPPSFASPGPSPLSSPASSPRTYRDDTDDPSPVTLAESAAGRLILLAVLMRFHEHG
ncbi:unnamed protein product [Symbiodinium natans]|uniref:Folate-biopterin transporter 2 n=1 Tax=Symbiodinium natans TaxID=878477 RepID=A0A812U2N9_9DINO|nr:unnamed protein product [Symbiodinium natans]